MIIDKQRKKTSRASRAQKPKRQVISLWRKVHGAPIEISANLLKILKLPEKVTSGLGNNKVAIVFEANGLTRVGAFVGSLPILTQIEDLNIVQDCLSQFDETTKLEAKNSSWEKLVRKYSLGQLSSESPAINAIRFLDMITNQNLATNDLEKGLLHVVDYEMHKICEWARTRLSSREDYKFSFHWVGSLVGGTSRTEPGEFTPFSVDSAKGWFYTNNLQEYLLLEQIVPSFVQEYETYSEICYPNGTDLARGRRYFPPFNIRLKDLRRLATTRQFQSEPNSIALERIQFFVPFADRKESQNSLYRRRVLAANKLQVLEFSNLTVYQVCQGLKDAYPPPVHMRITNVDLLPVETFKEQKVLPPDDYIPDIIGPIVPVAPRRNNGEGLPYAHRQLKTHDVNQVLRYEDRSRFNDWIQLIQSDSLATDLANKLVARYEYLQLNFNISTEDGAIT